MKNIAYVLLIAAGLSILSVQNSKAACDDIDKVTFFCASGSGRGETFPYWIGSASDGTAHLQKVGCSAPLFIDCRVMDGPNDTKKREAIRDWANSMREAVAARCK